LQYSQCVLSCDHVLRHRRVNRCRRVIRPRRLQLRVNRPSTEPFFLHRTFTIFLRAFILYGSLSSARGSCLHRTRSPWRVPVYQCQGTVRYRPSASVAAMLESYCATTGIHQHPCIVHDNSLSGAGLIDWLTFRIAPLTLNDRDDCDDFFRDLCLL
jgi:hypothetical protein